MKILKMMIYKVFKRICRIKTYIQHIQKFNKKKELSETKNCCDPEFKDLACAEISGLEERLQIQEQTLQLLLLPKDINDNDQ